MRTMLVQPQVDHRFQAWVKILMCLVGYLIVVLTAYWLIESAKVSLRSGFAFLLHGNFAILLVTWVVAFKPWKK
jgi:hypothetical protein